MSTSEFESVVRALRAHQEQGHGVAEAVAELRLAADRRIAEALASELSLLFTTIETVVPAAAALVPVDLAMSGPLCPLDVTAGVLRVAVFDPTDARLLDRLRSVCGLRVQPVVAARLDIERALRDSLERGVLREVSDSPVIDEGTGTGPEEIAADGEDPGVAVRLLTSLFAAAAEGPTTQIHIEALRAEGRVRFRQEGRLVPHLTLHRALLPPLLGRLKVIAGLDVAERRLPQDGEVRLRVGEKTVVGRIATMPTSWGERAVVTLSDPDEPVPRLDELGMPDDMLATYRGAIAQRSGIVLIAGPRDAGKTTLARATLRSLDTDELCLVSVEDEITQYLPGVSQVQVQPQFGMTRAAVMRAAIAQHADLISCAPGSYEEIELAVRGATSGALVLGRLPAYDAAAALLRLMDMGLEAYQVAASVRLSLTQRLVRKLCADCRVEAPPDAANALLRAELEAAFGADAPVTLYVARVRGCPACQNTGWRGRAGVFELLEMTPAVQQLLMTGCVSEGLRRHARRTLRQAALRLAAGGVTSLEEAVRTTPSDPRAE